MAEEEKRPLRLPEGPPSKPTFDFSGVRDYVGSIEEQLAGQIKIGESATGLKASLREVEFQFPEGYSPPPDNFNSIPNINKLSRFERKVMDFLPGFSESTIGQALAKFSEHPLGKALAFLDIGAEGLERLIGFGTQFVTSIGTDNWDNFRQNMSEAWYAGSLAADMANLPVVRDGSVLFPTDLPGEAGLTIARKAIIELVNQGMDRGDALVQVRDNYYNSMGALALRAQLHDAFFHVAGDPINIVMPYLKPVERLKVSTLARVTTGSVPEDVARVGSELADLLAAERKAGATADRIAEIQRAISWVDNADLLSPSQQRVLKLMGELPLQGDNFVARFLQSKWNPFGLTPNARAMELQNMVTDQALTRIVGALDDPEDIVRAIQRVADGTVSQEFGHLITSVQGRQVRSIIQAMEAEATSSLAVWRRTAPERNLFGFMGDVLGESPISLFNQVKNGEEAAVFSRLMDAVEGLGDDALNLFDEALIGADLTRDTFGSSVLKGMTQTFGKRTLITPEQFKIALTNDIVDQATRLAVAKFGVSARGFLVKFADSVKSAETLGFLRLNPAYPVRNFLNNEFTMLARGTWGGINTGDMLQFWKRLGFEPPRLRSGFGPAEIAEQLAKGDLVPGQQANLIAREIVSDAERGTFGWTEKTSNLFKNIDLKKFDMGKVSAKLESWASVRATTTGFRRYFSQHYNPVKLADYSTETATALAREIGEDGLRAWQQAIASQDTIKGIDALLFADDVALSERGIINLATQELGYDLYNVLPAEEVAQWMPRIIDAAKEGPTRLADEVSLIKKLVQENLANGNEVMMQDLIADVASRVETEGLGSLTKVFGDQFDEFWGFNAKHQMDMENLSQLARGALAGQGPEAANASWRAIFERSNLGYARIWDRMDGRMGAINEGIESIIKNMDEAGTMTPDVRKALRAFGKENVQNVKQWRKVWEGFFKDRNELLEGFFKAKLDKKDFKFTWDQIEETLSESYAKAVDLEDGIWQRIDDAANAIVPEQQRQLHRAWRDSVANIRRMDKQMVSDFRETIRGLSGAERNQAWNEFRPERLNNIAAIIEEEKAGIAALMGSAEHQARYAGNVEELRRLDDLFAELNTQLFDPARTPEELEIIRRQMARIDDIRRPVEAAPIGTDIPAIPDFDTFAPQELFKVIGDDQLWFSRGDEALDALGESARRISADPPVKFDTLSPAAQNGLRNYAELVKGGLSDARYQATRFGEWTRDSALLNYNRRFNYNTWLGVLAPYEFWATQTVFKWALHSIDRPAMLSTYIRMEKFMRTGFRPEPNRPSRIAGNIRIPMPFLPKWLGDGLFIDPLRTILPFKQFAFPLEQIQRQREGDAFTTERVLEELFNDGDITQEEYNMALTDKAGPIWDRAEYLARLDDAEGRHSPFDFASMLTSPHAPLAWAYNIARGEPERIGPFLPMTRSIRGITAMLGIGPNGGVNIEGAIRRELGLPEFDQWDDYRVDRMLSSMAATGEITTEEAMRAMIDREGEVFEEAERKAGKEFGIGAMGSMLGMPIKAYPDGEEILREAKDDYERAWSDYENSGDYDSTLGRFHEQNPGYEARLALWKKPEERLQRFLIDNIWDQWNDLPKLHKDELKEQMGDLFTGAFLSNDTRSYDSIPLETLSVWLRFMGGDPPGKLSPAVPIPPAVLSDPEVAQRLQVFYDTRNNTWRYWSAGGPAELQRDYFKLTEEGRKQFANDNPMLTQYWDWRRDFMQRNPDIAPYIEDDPDKQPKFESIEELRAAEAAQPNFTQFELQNLVGYPLYQLILLEQGDLPAIADDQLKDIAQAVGMSREAIIEQILQLTMSTVLQ